MKRLLDRFDNSPLWIRLLTVLFLTLVLVVGLYTVRRSTATQVTVVAQPAKKTGKLPVKKETKEEKAQKEEKQHEEAAEAAVSQLENVPSQEAVNAAQEAVAKVKDDAKKLAFQERVQYMANYYGLTLANSETTSEVTNQTGEIGTGETTVPQAVQEGQVQVPAQE